MVPTTDTQQWDRAVRLMVRRYRDWCIAYNLALRYQSEQSPGTFSVYHWNRMVEGFKRSASVGPQSRAEEDGGDDA